MLSLNARGLQEKKEIVIQLCSRIRKRGNKGGNKESMAELRSLKRRAGVAEEALRIKKEWLDEAEQEHEEEYSTLTYFSKQLEEKWEQRFDALARLAQDAGVRHEDVEAVRMQPWQAAAHMEQAMASAREARPHTMRYLVFRCYNEQAHLFRMHYSQAASQCRCEKMLAPLQHLKCRCMLKHGIPHQNAPQMHRLADHTVASERKDVVCFLRVSVLGSEFSMFASCLGELSNVI